MRRAFTLIELLVVMAIISILASILFPVFSRALDKARGTQCLSNVKQIQLALMMYASDYDWLYPMPPYLDAGGQVVLWSDALQPYMQNRQILACPDLANYPVGYALNYWMAGPGAVGARRSAQKVTLADASAPVAWYLYNEGGTDPDPDGDPSTVGSTPDPRHREGSNFAFADGHAKWFAKGHPGVANWSDAWDPQS